MPSFVRHTALLLGALLVALSRVEDAHAAGEAASSSLSLADAVRLAKTRGYDVLLASAEVRGAEADVRAQGAVPNPVAQGGVSRMLDCSGSACDGSPWGFSFGLADQGLVEGFLTRKRALRERVAERSSEAARFAKADAERVLTFATKVQYVETAAAEVRLDFVRDVAATLKKSVEVNRVRYPRVIDEGQLARVELEAMKADQEVARASRELRHAQIELALLVGQSGPAPEYVVDRDALKFRVPEGLATPNRVALLRTAMDERPDRKAALAREARAEEAITLARRQRVPDVSLWAQYLQQGTGPTATQPPTLSFGLALPLPLFYQQQGEVGRAEANHATARIERGRLENRVQAEFDTALNEFQAARGIVERYETSVLERARRAREITQVQYSAGSGTLTDLLDAQRTFVQVNSDYYAELVNYWTAVFMLEHALGKDLVP